MGEFIGLCHRLRSGGLQESNANLERAPTRLGRAASLDQIVQTPMSDRLYQSIPPDGPEIFQLGILIPEIPVQTSHSHCRKGSRETPLILYL